MASHNVHSALPRPPSLAPGEGSDAGQGIGSYPALAAAEIVAQEVEEHNRHPARRRAYAFYNAAGCQAIRHSRARGNPRPWGAWMPAFAGMTGCVPTRIGQNAQALRQGPGRDCIATGSPAGPPAQRAGSGV